MSGYGTPTGTIRVTAHRRRFDNWGHVRTSKQSDKLVLLTHGAGQFTSTTELFHFAALFHTHQ